MVGQVIVDVNSTNKFTKVDLETYKRLIVEEVYPHLFGEDLPKALRVRVKAQLIDIVDVNWRSSLTKQAARRGGKNPKLKQIARSIRDNGFKLMYCGICLFRKPNGELVPMNGRTRYEILYKNHSFTNIISIIFEAAPGATQDEVDDALSSFGVSSNSYGDPEGETQLEDVYTEVCHAIDMGWVKKDKNPMKFIESIRARVDLDAGRGCFAATKRDALVYRILNNYESSLDILSWTTGGEAERWLSDNNIVTIPPKGDKRGIKYIALSAESGAKTLISAVKFAYDNPNYDIRLVIHTGTLTGFDLEKCYIDKVVKFKNWWDAVISQLGYGFFNYQGENLGMLRRPITLYGVLPALSSVHDLEKLVKFVTPTPKNEYKLLSQSDSKGKVLYDYQIPEEDRAEAA